MKAQLHSTLSGISYVDEGHGTPILLIHGWGVSGACFNKQIEGLSDRFRVIVPDLPGHGSSVSLKSAAPFSELADRVHQWITELELHQFCLVGWSMGAMVAWDLLTRYPQLDATGLTIIDMAPRLLNEPNWPYGLRDGENETVFDPYVETMRKDWAGFTDVFVPRIFSAQPATQTSSLIEETKTIAMENSGDVMAHLWSEMAKQDFRDKLSSIELPTLLIAGQHSRLYGKSVSEWVAAQRAHSQLEFFSKSGHAPHMEEVTHFNHVLSVFVDSLHPIENLHVNTPGSAGINPQ